MSRDIRDRLAEALYEAWDENGWSSLTDWDRDSWLEEADRVLGRLPSVGLTISTIPEETGHQDDDGRAA